MCTYQIRLRCLPAIGVLLVCSTLGFAQSQPAPAKPPTENAPETASPLAAAARSTKEKAAHVKKVVTDEDMEATAGPLPRLKMDGAENADDVMTDRKSTRLNSSHLGISYAVFCLKKKPLGDLTHILAELRRRDTFIANLLLLILYGSGGARFADFFLTTRATEHFPFLSRRGAFQY